MLMFPLTFAGLLSTPAPSAAYIGIAFIALFGIMAVVVGPDYDGFNAPWPIELGSIFKKRSRRGLFFISAKKKEIA